MFREGRISIEQNDVHNTITHSMKNSALLANNCLKTSLPHSPASKASFKASRKLTKYSHTLYKIVKKHRFKTAAPRRLNFQK